MIVIITSCAYFRQGVSALVDQLKQEYVAFSQVIYAQNVAAIDEETLRDVKAIIVDYAHPDVSKLISLLEIKNKLINTYIVLITRGNCFENTIDNILINAVADFTIDCVSALRKLSIFLKKLEDGDQPMVITKNRRWYLIEKEKNLTRLETSLLPYILTGKNNKEISGYFSLTEKNVSHHRRNIYKKFEVNNLAGLYNKVGH